jgi:hypothetical protein
MMILAYKIVQSHSGGAMLGNIIEAVVEIEGTRPLLWHAFKPEALAPGRRERAGVAGNDPTEWQRTVLAHPTSRQLYIKPTYIFSCLREASRYTRQGRASFMTKLSATLQVQEEEIFVTNRALPETMTEDPENDVYLDIQGVKNPATKAKNLRYRVAAREGWQICFHLVWDRSLVPKEVMETILRDGGNLVGLGSGRNIGKGKFKVNRFEVTLVEAG